MNILRQKKKKDKAVRLHLCMSAVRLVEGDGIPDGVPMMMDILGVGKCDDLTHQHSRGAFMFFCRTTGDLIVCLKDQMDARGSKFHL